MFAFWIYKVSIFLYRYSFFSILPADLQLMKDYKVTKETLSAQFCREVYDIVALIPRGRVTTYGEIATLLGKPQCSRMVGKALKQVPEGELLPCHRVVNAQGRLVPGWEEQRALLLAEGVCLKRNVTVDWKQCRWDPS